MKVSEFSIKELVSQHNERAIHLRFTTNLIAEQTAPQWLWLLEQYRSFDCPAGISVPMVTLVNALLTQRRIFFAITRRGIRSLVKGDTNWPLHARKFSTKTYRELLASLLAGRVVRVEHSGTDKQVSIYEVIHPELLKFLKDSDYESQKREAVDFALRKAKDQTSDQTSDLVVSEQGQEEVKRNQIRSEPLRGGTPRGDDNLSEIVRAQIHRIEKLVNRPGAAPKESEMLSGWRGDLFRYKTSGLSDGKLRVLDRIENGLSASARSDLMTDDQMRSVELQDRLRDLMLASGVRDEQSIRSMLLETMSGKDIELMCSSGAKKYRLLDLINIISGNPAFTAVPRDSMAT